MRTIISAQLEKAINLVVIITAFATPIFFLPLTTEYYETPKLILLAVITLLLLTLTSVKWVLDGKMVINKTPLDLPLLLILIVLIASTIFSPVKQISIFGNLPRVHGSTISWISYILLYFFVVWNIRSKLQMKLVLYSLVGSSLVVSVVSILAYLNIQLPLSYAKFANFTPAGSTFSVLALSLLLSPLALISLIRPNKILPVPAALISAVVFSITIALLGDNKTYVLGALILIGVFLFSRNRNVTLTDQFTNLTKQGILFVVPLLVALVIIVVNIIPSFGGKVNPFNKLHNDFPREVQLDISESWKVASRAMGDFPLLGTGPSTFIFDFSFYRPIEHNMSKYWNVRFDSAYNELFSALTTLGIFGAVAFAFLLIMMLSLSIKGLYERDEVLTLGVSISGLVAVALLLTHVTSLVSIVVTLIIFAILVSIFKLARENGPAREITIPLRASRLEGKFDVSDVFPIILILLPVVLFVLYCTWNGVPVVLADYHHRRSLDAAASNKPLDSYNALNTAIFLNPRADLYHSYRAQTNFILANAIAQSKGPTESSPTGSLTDEDKKNIQGLLQQSIQSGQAAVFLNPLSSQNYEVLGSIYRQISGVAENALVLALDSYGKAIARDPLNPVLRLNVGGIYYSIKNYDYAERFFTDAANLKPDFANAYYNLSVTLREKGNLKGAQAAAERVVSLLDSNSNDYKVASEYLAGLKAQIATGSAETAQSTNIVPPAAQQSSALQKEELPKVIDLPKKENIATPEAVKKP